MVIEAVLIGVCILLSALFSGSETALTSLGDARLDQLIQERRTGTKLLKAWRDNPSVVLSFLLIGNNIVNILASSLATDFSFRLLDDTDFAAYAIALSVGVMTFLVLIFGEVFPKTFARHSPRLVVFVLPVLSVFYALLWPLAKMMGMMGRGFITLAGGDPHRPEPTITEEELEYLIRKGTREGSLDTEKEKMLSGVLNLEDSIVKEIMVPRTEVVMFEARDPLSRVMQLVEESKFSRYPVCQEAKDKVVGFFYAKDLLTYFRNGSSSQEAFRLRNFVRPPYYVPETKRLDELMREFQEEHTHMAIVVDEYGGTAGLVTLEDIIEEMVGEIYDEYDEEEDIVTKLSDHIYLADSKLPVEDLADELNLNIHFPEDRDYESLGGLVLELAGRVPNENEHFSYTNEEDRDSVTLNLKVLDSDGVKIGKIQMEVIPPGGHPVVSEVVEEE